MIDKNCVKSKVTPMFARLPSKSNYSNINFSKSVNFAQQFLKLKLITRIKVG